MSSGKTFFIIILIMLSGCSLAAQKSSASLLKEFKKLAGCWRGTLNYSGTMIRKPYTATEELIIKQIGKSEKFEFLHIYSKEASENTCDTISLSSARFNNETIKSKHRRQGNFEIITLRSGFDHDNDKAATFRSTYTFGKYIYVCKKEIRPDGQRNWIERQQFKYVRMSCKELQQ